MPPKKNAKRSLRNEVPLKSGGVGVNLNFGIRINNNNAMFVEAFGSKQDKIFTLDNDNNSIEIPWKDRLKPEIINMVASYRKYTIDIGEEREEFISQLDFVERAAELLSTYNGRIGVSGTFNVSENKGKFYNHYQIQRIYKVNDDIKSKSEVSVDIFYNKDSLDKADWESEKVLTLNGYIYQYINKDTGYKFIPMSFTFNASKANMKDEKQAAKVQYRLEYLDIQNKKMCHIPWQCKAIRGADEVEFDESMLTKAQKRQVELGLASVDDFKESVYGDRVEQIRLVLPILKGDFIDGIVETEYSQSEFDDEIYTVVKQEKMSDVEKKSKTQVDDEISENEDTPEIDDDDLF